MVDLRDGLMHQVGMSKEKAEEVVAFLADNAATVSRFLAAIDGGAAAAEDGESAPVRGGGARCR